MRDQNKGCSQSWTGLGLAWCEQMESSEETDLAGRREFSLGEGPTLLQRRRRPGEYEALGLGKILEVTLMVLLVWGGVLTLPEVKERLQDLA